MEVILEVIFEFFAGLFEHFSLKKHKALRGSKEFSKNVQELIDQNRPSNSD